MGTNQKAWGVPEGGESRCRLAWGWAGSPGQRPPALANAGQVPPSGALATAVSWQLAVWTGPRESGASGRGWCPEGRRPLLLGRPHSWRPQVPGSWTQPLPPSAARASRRPSGTPISQAPGAAGPAAG